MKKLAWVTVLSLVTLAGTIAPPRAHAAFHLWTVREVFTNADGSIQYIELFTTSEGQTAVSGHTVTATSDGVTNTFTIPSNVSGSTTNRALLFATPGFANIPGAPTPDFILPCGPFFQPGATSITIAFPGADSLTFAGSELPVDGALSLHDSMPAGTATLASDANSPENLAGDGGAAVTLSTCLAAGTCDACDDGMFCNGAEVCTVDECVAASTDPCGGTLTCDEGLDACTGCTTNPECDDGNACTDDECGGGTCLHAPNSGSCSDGMFCTMTDMCMDGACVGSGDPCGGQQCNEGPDSCGSCTMDVECNDGMFCNGAETCNAGTCVNAPEPPCDATTGTCDEDTDVCVLFCGNGMNDGAEGCDDGNRTDGDGCSATCTVEAGFTCDTTMEPSVCEATAPTDGGMGTDAGMRTDAGMMPIEEEGGCGCRASSGDGRGALAMLALLGLAFVLRRRR